MMEVSCGIITTAALLLLITLICGTQADVRIVEPVDKSVNLAEGSDATFKCRHPSTESVEWSLNGLRIQDSGLDPLRFHVTTSDDEDEGLHSSISTLTVRGITPSDRGLYKCSNTDVEKAMFEQETETDSVEVKVIARLNVALAIEGPENGLVVAGRDLRLTCRGHSSSHIVWYFNKDELRQGTDVAIEEKRDDKTSVKDSVLTVAGVNSHRQGKYRCHDRASGSDASIDIRVTGTADLGNVRIVEPVDKSVNLAEGSDSTFKCRHPSTESVEWSLNGLRIQDSGLDPLRFHVSTSDEDEGLHSSISTLTVRGITPSDRGLYKCSNTDTEKALLEPERETDSVDVKVIARLKIALAIEGPENGLVVAGRDLWLTCRGHSSSHIVWYFNKDELRQGTDVAIEEKRDDKTGIKDSVLTVAGVNSHRQGKYRCHDRTSGSEASIDIQVTGTDGGQVGAATSKGFRFQCSVTFLLPIITVFALIKKTA